MTDWRTVVREIRRAKEPVSREDVETVRTLFELGCTCGVITLEDGVRWDAAQKNAERLIAKLEALVPLRR